MNTIKNITVVGAGGIGRSLALYLNDLSYRDIPYLKNIVFHWYDDDDISEENLWTQGFKYEAYVRCDTKVVALKDEMKNLKIVANEKKFNVKENFFIDGNMPDAIMIACDNLETRKEIYEYCFTMKAYFIDMRVNGKQLFVADSNCNRKELEESLIPSATDNAPTSCLYKWEKENKILRATPMVAASAGVSFLLDHLIEGDKLESEILTISL